MKKSFERSTSQIRKERNLDIVRRMRNGEDLNQFDSHASWYPPRPIIKKDKGAISRLYGTSHTVDEHPHFVPRRKLS